MNILKNNKPNCFGKSMKLSIECNKCVVKNKCLDYINLRASGTFFIPTDKTYPKSPMISNIKQSKKVNKVDIEDLKSMYRLFKDAIMCDEPDCQDAIDIMNKYELEIDEELNIIED